MRDHSRREAQSKVVHVVLAPVANLIRHVLHEEGTQPADGTFLDLGGEKRRTHGERIESLAGIADSDAEPAVRLGSIADIDRYCFPFRVRVMNHFHDSIL